MSSELLRKYITAIDFDNLFEHFKDVICDNNSEHLGLLTFLTRRIESSTDIIKTYEELGSSNLFMGSRNKTIVHLLKFSNNSSAQLEVRMARSLSIDEVKYRQKVIGDRLVELESQFKLWKNNAK
jgi:hypothetical protein